MDRKRLKIARKKIDSIDNKIFSLIKKRTKIIDHMILIKEYKSQIVDHKRMNLILKKIKKKSKDSKIDSKITLKIWKSMILSYVDYQRRNFKK
jgi:chorismate mutase|tara:strand:- start:8727 stop:9005 length:279 start_codon:yes stop_codon:yes gene_type:complete